MTSVLRRAFLAALFAATLARPLHAQDWTPPTPEELAMTSVPEAPGVSAVILYHEENTVSADRAAYIYTRIKILNDKGKDSANIELPYFDGYIGVDFDKIAGRTIHRDGSIYPLTDKPYDKFIEKEQGHKYKAKVFTLPAVEVGSIIEYRYKRTTTFLPTPDWFPQANLFTLKAHYSWHPSNVISDPIAFTSILPRNLQVQSLKNGQFVLDVDHIAPQPDEEMMPPVDSVSYRVLFYYTGYKTPAEFWHEVGNRWSEAVNDVVAPTRGIRSAVAALVAPGDTSNAKLHKIYDAVMSLDNTDYARQLSSRELKAQHKKDIKNVQDVLTRKGGPSDDLTLLFVSMARAAGFKAYLMVVADRSERLFVQSYLNLDQIDDYIAIVNIDGVETYFDPGERFCPYAQLAWVHTLAGGLRQTEKGSELATTPATPFKQNHISRAASLALDAKGDATGKVVLTYEGDPARRWRQRALTDDETALKADLRKELEGLLPPGVEVTVTSTGDLTHFDAPLAVTYDVHGPVGSSTGKRLIIPANLFQASVKPAFLPEKREKSVDLHFGSVTQDAVRYTYPKSLTLESTPSPGAAEIKGEAAFSTSSQPSARPDHSIPEPRFRTLHLPRLRLPQPPRLLPKNGRPRSGLAPLHPHPAIDLDQRNYAVVMKNLRRRHRPPTQGTATMTHSVRLALLLTLAVAPSLAPSIHAQAFLPPTPEELSMTSIPEVPGAIAVVLYKEETTDDALRSYGYYYRTKILTEGGKDLANVELRSGGETGVTVDSVSGRTIHPDGTIIPFTGKPYEKVVVKVGGYKYKQKVFTLPDVTVGSIIEYRYKMHYDDSFFKSPDWDIQGDLFVRKAHFWWNTTHSGGQTIVDSRGNALDNIAWTPILPPGDKVVESNTGGRRIVSLDIANVRPLPKEDFMPPIECISYRVLFYYTNYKTSAEYWKEEGKNWSKERDKFIGPGKGVKQAVATMYDPADSQDVKLRKIYAAVQALENTNFTRERSTQEESAAGFKAAQSTDDILSRKRGNDDQLACLFVALARAAGFKAYLMGVADRNQRLFLVNYLSLYQLDDDIAIVNVDGKDIYLDPGQRYCTYGQLAWKHTLSAGLRQLDNGTAIATTPGGSYKESVISRIADLTLDEQGLATGAVNITYTGAPALRWRQDALRGDATSINEDLKQNLEQMLPGNMDVKVGKVENLTDPDKPLKVAYEVKGPIGSSTGKRLLVVADLFELNTKPRFPQATRDETVDMRYPSASTDAVRYKFPAGLVIESSPAAVEEKLNDVADFKTDAKPTPTSITFYRNVIVGKTYFSPAEYPALRTFYTKIEAKDQETMILTHAPTASKGQ